MFLVPLLGSVELSCHVLGSLEGVSVEFAEDVSESVLNDRALLLQFSSQRVCVAQHAVDTVLKLVDLSWILVAEKVDSGVGELLSDATEDVVGLSFVLGGLGADLVGDSCNK
jgi:hypothetical protein